jgi:hypothetical protein
MENIKIIINDYNKLKSIKKVSLIHNISYEKIRKLLKINNVEMIFKNTKNLKKLNSALTDYKNGNSINQIYIKYGFSNNFFKKLLKQNELTYVNKAKFPNNTESSIIREKIKEIHDFYIKHKNLRKTANFFNIKECNLRSFFTKNNLLQKKHTSFCKKTQLEYKDIIHDLYIIEKMNIQDISKKIKITPYNIKKILIDNFGNSIIRPKSQIIKEMNYKKEHQIKAHNGSFKRKNYILPSGKIIKVQGYEDDFLNYIFKNNKLQEQDFNFNDRIRIELSKNNVKHKHYYPDFYIPKYNLIIEIKSNYIYNLQRKLNEKKKKETIKAGYYYIILKEKNYKPFDKFLNETKK